MPTLGLFFWKHKKAIVGGRIAKIYLKEYSTDEKGRILLTPQCVLFSELDCWIDYLQEELEKIRKSAKRKFAKASN